MAEQPFGVAQLILLLVLGGLAIRYFFPSSTLSSQPRSTHHASGTSAREVDVEIIQQMFPQVSRRHIMWDLQRSGGNVAATTERILSGRGLEIPPPSFQPLLPAATPAVASVPARSQPLHTDLITRYHLEDKVANPNVEEEESLQINTKQGQAWSANKAERQALLQKRRELMILAARKKMEAKIMTEAEQKI
ncbi:hypothetical protein K3495_g7614 [Podosphaera aphanis]|nr:hypothetical protein K3495_g7614 [Podosphaera aphanis]